MTEAVPGGISVAKHYTHTRTGGQGDVMFLLRPGAGNRSDFILVSYRMFVNGDTVGRSHEASVALEHATTPEVPENNKPLYYLNYSRGAGTTTSTQGPSSDFSHASMPTLISRNGSWSPAGPGPLVMFLIRGVANNATVSLSVWTRCDGKEPVMTAVNV